MIAEGNALVAVWRGAPTRARFQAIANAVRTRNLWPTSFVILNYIGPETPLPDKDAREAVRAFFESMGSRLLGIANVLDKQGLQATLSRAVVKGITAVTRHSFPIRVFASLDPAAEWLSKSFTTSPDEATLLAAVRAGQAQLVRKTA
jgi:hypothetical protein